MVSKLKTQNSKLRTQRSGRRGMAMLAVLFIIMMVVVVSLGILYRSDMALAGGHNYTLRTQADYIAWAGLEHARALILNTPDNPVHPENPDNDAPFALDERNVFYYTLLPIGEPNITDPNLWRYDVGCEVYYTKTTATQPCSKLTATVLYDPNGLAPKAWFTNIRHPQ